jgi:hypothetical protein
MKEFFHKRQKIFEPHYIGFNLHFICATNRLVHSTPGFQKAQNVLNTGVRRFSKRENFKEKDAIRPAEI